MAKCVNLTRDITFNEDAHHLSSKHLVMTEHEYFAQINTAPPKEDVTKSPQYHTSDETRYEEVKKTVCFYARTVFQKRILSATK